MHMALAVTPLMLQSNGPVKRRTGHRNEFFAITTEGSRGPAGSLLGPDVPKPKTLSPDARSRLLACSFLHGADLRTPVDSDWQMLDCTYGFRSPVVGLGVSSRLWPLALTYSNGASS